MHRKPPVEYGGTDEEEEEKAPRRISHRRGGKGSGDGDEDVDHKKVVNKVQKNPRPVREKDASDSSDSDPPLGILVDKGKARKRSPLFDESGSESSDVQIVENNTTGMLTRLHNSGYSPFIHRNPTITSTFQTPLISHRRARG